LDCWTYRAEGFEPPAAALGGSAPERERGYVAHPLIDKTDFIPCGVLLPLGTNILTISSFGGQRDKQPKSDLTTM
jgi:hypothetical protein